MRIESPADITRAFTAYLSSNLNNDDLVPSEIHPMLTSARLSSSLFDIAGIMAVLKRSKSSCRPRHYGIPPVLCRAARPGLPPFLLNFFLLSSSRATIPPRWKTFIIVTHHNKVSAHDPGNYRAIGHTPVLFKFMKIAVNGQPVNILTTHGFNNPFQNGFLMADPSSPVSLNSCA